MKRVVLLSPPPFEAHPSGGFSCGGSPPPADIRKYLLYWDKIDYPDNNFISIGPCPDIQFLIDSGIAERTHVQFRGAMSSGNGELFIIAQQAAFTEHQSKTPGAWSLAQISTTPHFIDVSSKVAVEYELWNMLPVPQKDVPLNEILEFKTKHNAELIALRVYLDELYQSIISSSDLPRAKNTQLIKLEKALIDIDRTMGEFQLPREITSLRGFLSVANDSIFTGGFGALGASQFGFDPIAAACVGASICFVVKTMSLPAALSNSAPSLTYVSSIKRNL